MTSKQKMKQKIDWNNKEEIKSYYKKYREQNKEIINKQKKHYKNTEKGKKANDKYNKSIKGLLRKSKDVLNHPEHYKARREVSNAIRNKKLKSPKGLICSKCNDEKAKHYHHYNGYGKEQRLDIIPLCISCHKKEHTPKNLIDIKEGEIKKW